MTHLLYVNSDFSDEELARNNKLAEMVVVGGLSVCKRCGEYESGLDNPCKNFISNPVSTSLTYWSPSKKSFALWCYKVKFGERVSKYYRLNKPTERQMRQMKKRSIALFRLPY